VTLSSAGVLSGTPTVAGSSTFTVQATDAAARTATQAMTLVVAAAVSITTTTVPPGTIGVIYNQTLVATGGATPYAWAVASGTLPAGVTLSGAGVLSGTPTVAGSSTFTVQATDAALRTATRALTVVVSAPLGITTTTLPAATAGTAYSQALAATGGATPYTWAVAAGTLPAGLTLSSAGVLSGTPSTAATSSFTVRVTDADARTTTEALSVAVNPGPPAQIVWVQQPSNVAANDAIAPAPSVRVNDSAGNPVATAAVTMSIANPSGRSFTATSATTANAVGGVAMFSNLRIATTNNSYRIRASAGSILSPESGSFRVQ
jgi:hypothetical protein